MIDATPWMAMAILLAMLIVVSLFEGSPTASDRSRLPELSSR
jgi:hypothetical protein